MPSRIHTFPSGRQVALIPRAQLRAHPSAKRTRRARTGAPVPPAAPASWDNSRGEQIDYQCYCNGPPWPNPLGDCFYEAIVHGSSNWTANSGTEFEANAEAVAARYLALSGGDNGLSDQDVMPEWLAGIVGPSGPRKILDWMVVTAPVGGPQWQQMMWACGGLIWTCSLCEEWLSADSPGAIWDAGSPDPEAGHAMFLTGRRAATGPTDTRTWGITPPIDVTDAGFASAESEFIALFSADQFAASNGVCVFSGMTWEAKREWWLSIGGKDVGTSPFGPTPPVPPVPPTPPTPTTNWTGTLVYTDGVLVSATPSVQPTPTPGPAPTPPAPPAPPSVLPGGNWVAALVDLARLAEDTISGNWNAIGADLAQLLLDLGTTPTPTQLAGVNNGMARTLAAARASAARKKR